VISQHFNPEWPARSPDLTPFGFSIFERLKDIVYKQRLQNVEQLMHEITHCCEDISEVMLQNILENKKGRVLLEYVYNKMEGTFNISCVVMYC
jgi:hypothetical protein